MKEMDFTEFAVSIFFLCAAFFIASLGIALIAKAVGWI